MVMNLHIVCLDSNLMVSCDISVHSSFANQDLGNRVVILVVLLRRYCPVLYAFNYSIAHFECVCQYSLEIHRHRMNYILTRHFISNSFVEFRIFMLSESPDVT